MSTYYVQDLSETHLGLSNPLEVSHNAHSKDIPQHPIQSVTTINRQTLQNIELVSQT
jgi:hypothetical protein